MALFYSSAFKSGPSGETLAVKNYNAALAKAKADSDTGDIVDPTIYTNLAERYLSPFISDPTVQRAYYGAVADSKKVASAAEDVDFVKKIYEANVTDNILKSTKDAVNNNATPDAIVGTHAYWYDQAAIKLQNEITQRRNNNQTTNLSTLTTLYEDYSQKATSLAELYNGMKSGDESVNKENYGLFIQTNPNTGKVLSARIDTVDSLSKVPGGFVQTSDKYGGIPLYLNSYQEGTVARLGDRQYRVDTVKDLSGKNKDEALAPEAQHGPIYKFFHHGIPQEKNTSTELTTLGTVFDQVLNLPPHSAARDSSGNYYYLNDKGEVYKGSAETIAPMFGVTPDQVKTDSYFLSKDQVQGFGTTKSLDSVMKGPTAPPAAEVPSANTLAPNETPLGPPAPPSSQAGPANRNVALQQPKGQERQANTTENIVKSGITKIADFGKRLFTGRA